MLFRTEAPADILPIDRLLKASFETDAEANLVMSLRENSRLTLSLVACNDEGEVVGYVMFTPVFVEGHELTWQGLAPLAVREDHRNQGIAETMVKEAFETLIDFGYGACVVLGNPDYYSRLGFESAENKGLKCKWDVPAGAFQVHSLIDGALGEVTGLVNYCPEFDEL
jgi:putative acetyltransferase